MGKFLKRVLSVMVAVLMLVATPIGLFKIESEATDEASSAVEFEADSGETAPGGIVEIPVRISNNSGIKGFYTKISYDSNVLTPIEVKKGTAFDTGDIISNLEKPTQGELNVVGYGARTASNDGVLYTVVFKVSDTASGSYEINLSYDRDNTYDGNMNGIIASCINGSIYVTEGSTTKTLLYISNQTVVCGEYVRIPIKIKNQKTTRALSFKVNFDSSFLQLISVGSEVATLLYLYNDDSITISVTDLKQCIDGDTVAYIKMNAKAVAKTAIIITAEEDVNATGGIITIDNNVSLNPTFYARNTVGKNGSTVAVPICIKNNPGIAGYKLKIGFDSKALSPERIEDSTSYSGELNNLGIKSSEISVIWINYSQNDVTENGDLFTLYFKVLKEGIHNVSVTYSKADTFNNAFEEIEFTCIEGKVFAEKMLMPREDKNAVIDLDRKYIYGLDVGMKTINSYVYASDGYTISEIPGKMGLGTSSVVNVIYGNDIADTYTVIVFGDVNGDGLCDGQDAVTVNMLANGMLTREQVGEGAWLAADGNHDGVIDQADVDLLNQTGVFLANINQTKMTDK